MKTALIAALLTAISINTVFAADNTDKSQKIEQKKAEILQHIDRKMAHIQQEKSCVQAATSHEALKACREKAHAEMKGDRPNRK